MSELDAAVLIAHGARDARWLEPFARLEASLRERFGAGAVIVSYLEFATPSFADAVLALTRGGARRLLVVPVFLSGGGHVARDVPELVRMATERHPDVSFVVTGAIGEEPEVARAMEAAIARQLSAKVR